jgi:hypothetical protein
MGNTVKLIMDADNPLTDSDAPNQGELHMQAGDIVTIIDPEGDELIIYLNDDGKMVAN